MRILPGENDENVDQAVRALLSGNLVIFPTETVYGLGADANNSSALKRIFKVKGRPIGHPLIVHLADTSQLNLYSSSITSYATKLGENFWPGPMTLVLSKKSFVNDYVTGEQNTVALRIPNNTVALDLIGKFQQKGGMGIAAPSANLFGEVSATNPNMAIDSLGSRLTKRDILLIGDQSKIGIESTIIDCTREIPIILRPGFITKQMIEGLLGISVNSLEANIAVKFSGNFKSHYSPKAKVVIGGPYEFGAGFIAIRDIPTPPSLIRLSTPINNYEFAATLYESFAKADSLNLSSIHIIPATGNDLAIAINDRIKKASSEL